MNISAPFIKRPIGTSLLAAALLMAGALAFDFLPVAPLPQVEFPVIRVSAGWPGASPETMASAVATPLERQFGRIAGINQMTSTSQLGSTSIVLQFDLNRNIDAAGRDVQAAINAARSQLPANLPGNPSYRKVNPADAPILILALTSDILTLPKMYDTADSILAQKLAQIDGVGQVFVGGGARPAVRAELNPTLLNKLGVGLDTVRTALGSANANRPKGELADPVNAWGIGANDQIFRADQYRKLIVAYKNGAPVRLGDVGDVQDSVEDIHVIGLSSGKPAVLIIIFRQPGANIIQTVDRVRDALPLLKCTISPAIYLNVVLDRRVAARAYVYECGSGGVSRGARDRFYGAVDEHVSGGCVYSDSDDGRNCGAAVPRIRRDLECCNRGFPARVPYDYANNVREISASAGRRKARSDLPRQRASIRPHARHVSREPALGTEASATYFVDHNSHGSTQRLLVYGRGQGFLPAAGHGPDYGIGTGRRIFPLRQ